MIYDSRFTIYNLLFTSYSILLTINLTPTIDLHIGHNSMRPLQLPISGLARGEGQRAHAQVVPRQRRALAEQRALIGRAHRAVQHQGTPGQVFCPAGDNVLHVLREERGFMIGSLVLVTAELLALIGRAHYKVPRDTQANFQPNS